MPVGGQRLCGMRWRRGPGGMDRLGWKESVGWGSRAFFNDPRGGPALAKKGCWLEKGCRVTPVPLYRTHPKSSRRMEDDRGSWGWESRLLSGSELLGRTPPPPGRGDGRPSALRKPCWLAQLLERGGEFKHHLPIQRGYAPIIARK